ncbi:Polyketide synthase PksJ [Micromonospora sp. MH33]|uniref:SDR family NAD(P)-dependent oxidoreductase n=1 Tax=Micromonospora sp. MH33 TaxID=1945509 RepID=UPI000D2D360E|nr:SDR family NAD(P)-dependent oxidoreductase [Micromonospora sp. MH33]PSK67659.1 Polyketide synthase PksJ [Micromonospora sp. MH33]
MTRMYSLQLVACPAVPGLAERESLPRGALVLTDDWDIANQLSISADPSVATVVVPADAATWEEDAIVKLMTVGERVPSHIRVITSLHLTRWPTAPQPRLLALQEAAFLAAKQLAHSNPPDSSLAALVLDPLKGGTPHPHGALLTGLIKAIAWELPHTHVHAVVTDAAALPTALAQLRRESACVRGLPVTYYRGQSTSATRLEERLLPDNEPTVGAHDGAHRWSTGEGPVVLAVGGARGITARCLEGLRTRPSALWLLGSTDPETMVEQSREIGETTSTEYARKRRAADPEVHIAQVRSFYDRCRKSRESLSHLAVLRQRFGATRVRYVGCDVTDEIAVRRVAAMIRKTTPLLGLVINGAGISGARRLAAKDLTTFRKVRDTKVVGYHNLKAAFSDLAPGLWCNFSSVAGAFGLAGESDYGPANDFLNSAARYETAHSGAAEYSICWSLWGESGLGPRTGFTEYTARAGQLGLLGDAEGQRLFNTEVEAHRSERRAVPTPLGNEELQMLCTKFPALVDATQPTPYLGTPSWLDGGQLVWELDLGRYVHLYGHIRESRALVPGALALELAAEAAGYLVGAAPVSTFRNIRFQAPIAVDPQVVRYVLTASYTPAGFDCGVVQVGIHSRVLGGNHDRRVQHFGVLIPIGGVATSDQCHNLRVATTARRASATMSMSGLFDHVRDVRLSARVTSARWEPPLPGGNDDEFFSRHRIPWLLADALLQTACSTGTPNRYATPHSIEELRLHTTDNDFMLSKVTYGVQLHVDHSDGIAEGVAFESGNGETLLAMSGLAVSGRTWRSGKGHE